MNIADTATAIAMGKIFFFIFHPPSRLMSRA
jgi:hypothetical protein